METVTILLLTRHAVTIPIKAVDIRAGDVYRASHIGRAVAGTSGAIDIARNKISYILKIDYF